MANPLAVSPYSAVGRPARPWARLMLAVGVAAGLAATAVQAAGDPSPFSGTDVVPRPEPFRAPPAPPAASPGPLKPDSPRPGARPTDGPRFTISQFIFDYGHGMTHPQLPPLTELDDLHVVLGKTDGGYVAPRAGVEQVTLRLGDLPTETFQDFYASAVLQVNLSVVNYFNERHGLVAVYVSPNSQDISEERTTRPNEPPQTVFRDKRGSTTALREVVTVGVVADVRTICSGQRIKSSERINHPLYARILAASPVKAQTSFHALLLEKEQFIGELNPERRVDRASGRAYVAWVGVLGSSGETAEQSLEYPCSVWSLDDARDHALTTGSVFQETEVQRQDLLDKVALDRYVCWLSRHPGRRVDMAVAATGERPGEVGLDFLVNETKPWVAYAQYSNTGTRSTNKNRLRFGFIHNQLTNHDDILDVDYSTACFDSSQAILAKYNAPLPWLERVRWEAKASWDEFDATEVGAAGTDISGHGAIVGANLIANVYQHHDFFVDLVAGADWRHIYVNNPTADATTEVDYAVPRVGARAERIREASKLWADVNFEYGQPCGDINQRDLDTLGRFDADKYWHAYYGSAAYSFFLEPLLAPSEWEDPSSRWATLAHEIMVGGAWQYARDNRLIPHARMVTGGLYSVRGYPESIVSGDSAFFAQSEYRFHVPRAINPAAQGKREGDAAAWDILGKKFHYLPQHPYGQADWDLILRGFVDVARTINTNRIDGLEYNETLCGTGLGAELKIYQNVSLRLDWGVPLIATQDGQADAGVQRVHVVVTLVY